MQDNKAGFMEGELIERLYRHNILKVDVNRTDFEGFKKMDDTKNLKLQCTLQGTHRNAGSTAGDRKEG